MNSTVAISILISLAVNEFIGVTDWLAYRITRWAAARWKAKMCFDHLDEWLEDLEHSPGRLFRVISSSWLLLGTFVGVERLTLNLPSLWRISLPLRTAFHGAFRVICDLIGALKRRAAVGFFPNFATRFHTAIVKVAVSLLPRREQPRYSEEWVAELYEVPGRERTRWVIHLLLSAPRLAVWMRLRSASP